LFFSVVGVVMAESMGLDRLAEFASIRAAAQKIAGESERLAALCVEIQQIPAPTGAEELRADWVEERFQRLGLADIDRDDTLNVYARVLGRQSTPALLVSAHTDTVFPAATDLTVRVDPATGSIAGPSIGDNSTGLAGLMVLAEVLAGLEQPPVDIWLVANSTEEGLGDLKGIRAAVDRLQDRLQDRLGAVLVLEGMGLGRLVHAGLGVRRYRIHAAAPGGHSWGDFGSASAIHSLAALATEITRLNVPRQPRTSYNIGKFEGARRSTRLLSTRRWSWTYAAWPWNRWPSWMNRCSDWSNAISAATRRQKTASSFRWRQSATGLPGRFPKAIR
jgi:tripeptide aminopeptidase